MKALDLKLYEIIESSNIDFLDDYVESILKKEYTNLNIVEDILMIWDNIAIEERLAIYGAGAHTLKLFDVVNKDKKNIVCIVDKLKPNGILCGYPLIKDYQMHEYNVETVFISSLGFREEIKTEIHKSLPNCKIIDIYDELKVKGYSFKEPFYYQMKYEIYYKFHAISKLYQKTNRQQYLKNLIYKYLMIKDFDSAYKLIDTYISQKYENFEQFIILSKKLKVFHNEIINKLTSRTANNGLIIMIDALRYRDIESMPYLSSVIQNNILCSRAYTHVPYTHMSLESLFTEKTLLDNMLYQRSSVNKNEKFFKEIEELGGSFKYSGSMVHIFPEDMIRPSKYGCCAENLWNYICDIYEEKSVDVSLLHFAETHTPFICGEHKDDIIMYGVFSRDKVDDIKHEYNQHQETVTYVNRQLEFYMKYFMDFTQIIICSDHGYIFDTDKLTIDKQYWNEDMVHIPYAIIKKDNEHQVYDKLISHLDTVNIMLNLLKKKNPFTNISEKQLVEVNRDFTYSKNDLTCMKELGLLSLGRAFKCFITNKEKYIIYYDGSEEFYLLEDEGENLLDNIKYHDRVVYLKNLINTEFPNWNESRFEYVKEFFNINGMDGSFTNGEC